MLAMIAVFIAVFRDWSPYLSPGERGTVMILSADRKQSRAIFGYAAAFLKALEVAADFPDRHAAGVHRIEGPSPIARHRQCHLRSASQNRLLRITVAVIAFGFAAVAVQMLVNLSVQNPLTGSHHDAGVAPQKPGASAFAGTGRSG
jgi:hypothetical protein